MGSFALIRHLRDCAELGFLLIALAIVFFLATFIFVGCAQVGAPAQAQAPAPASGNNDPEEILYCVPVPEAPPIDEEDGGLRGG